MTADADEVTRALGDALQLLCSAHPTGWMRREAGVAVLVTGVPAPTLNGVLAEDPGCDPGRVNALLDEVAAAGVPYCLQLRPHSGPALADLPARRGMTQAEAIPLMVLAEPLPSIQPPAGRAFTIRQLTSGEAELHASVAAAGFGASAELFRRLVTPSVLGAAGVRCYIAAVGGRPVSTGVGVRAGRYVGLFNVATPAADRGHGFGAAVTARIVADGLADGAERALLQSSPDGYRVYQRLGFRTVETWDVWVAAH